eukprot:gene18794-22451_t
MALVDTLQPDVLCLNEVLHPFVPPSDGGVYWNEVKAKRGRSYIPKDPPPQEADTYLTRLASSAGFEYAVFAEATREGFFGAFGFGNAILSRYPLLGVQTKRLEAEAGDINLGDQVREYVEGRSAVSATVEVPLPRGIPGAEVGLLAVCCTHLDHKSEELREKQIEAVIQWLKETTRADVAHCICGDLNAFQRADHDDETWSRICKMYVENFSARPPPESSLVLDAISRAGFQDTFYTSKAFKDNMPTSIHPVGNFAKRKNDTLNSNLQKE